MRRQRPRFHIRLLLRQPRDARDPSALRKHKHRPPRILAEVSTERRHQLRIRKRLTPIRQQNGCVRCGGSFATNISYSFLPFLYRASVPPGMNGLPINSLSTTFVSTRFAVANRCDSSEGFGASACFAASAAGFGCDPQELNNTAKAASTRRMIRSITRSARTHACRVHNLVNA